MPTIIMNVRECDTCGHRAIALDGEGTNCLECDDGIYAESVDWKEFQISVEQAEEYRENQSDHDEIINVSGN